MKALLSVYDKTGLVELAAQLTGIGFDLVSTGGTYQALADQSLPVQQVSDLTGSPEILGGRVKTLHPKIHGGILARRDLPDHLSELAQHSIDTIDLVAVNLYPFAETINRPGTTLEEALENIDVGGPTMIRAAAKNFQHVVVLVAERLTTQGLSTEERKGLAQKAFQHVALYDTLIARYLAHGADDALPEAITLGYRKLYDLRYGENPHQRAAFYSDARRAGGIAAARRLHGKDLSFNNILDADAAWRVVRDFAEPAVAVIKHCNPCGLAVDDNLALAYQRAYEGDPISAYGGIVAFNREVTQEAAEAMRRIFYEVVVAPSYEAGALEVLTKKRDLRVLELPWTDEDPEEAYDLRRVSGGLLLQWPDDIEEDPPSWKTVTQKSPSPEELADLAFAWKAAKHIKSNAIVLARDKAILGMGAGQPNRLVSVHLALRAAGERAPGSVLASDAFFPFADGVEMAAQGGVKAVVQPGGSIRDQEVIEAADRLGVVMVFTGVRHFRH